MNYIQQPAGRGQEFFIDFNDGTFGPAFEFAIMDSGVHDKNN